MGRARWRCVAFLITAREDLLAKLTKRHVLLISGGNQSVKPRRDADTVLSQLAAELRRVQLLVTEVLHCPLQVCDCHIVAVGVENARQAGSLKVVLTSLQVAVPVLIVRTVLRAEVLRCEVDGDFWQHLDLHIKPFG